MSTLTADQKEQIMSARGQSASENTFSLCDASGGKRSIWWVHLPGRKPFTMGGSAMTHGEALNTALSIWVKVEPKSEIKVTDSELSHDQ